MTTQERGIIGGTGFYEIAREPVKIETDYGGVNVSTLEVGGKQVYFVSRHKGLETPDKVNYRANIQALKRCGVNVIYSVSAAGRLAEDVLPGHFVAIDDVDWDDATGKYREMTYAEQGLLLHASMNDPFSSGLRQILVDAWPTAKPKVEALYDGSPDLKVGFHDSGTYFNVNGPHFSPPAREARIRNTVVNPKLIGQTLVPEVQLAREMGIAYAALGMCVDNSNYPKAKPVTHADGVMHAVVKTAQAAVEVLNEAVRRTPEDFYDVVAHEAMIHSLHSSQVDLDVLRAAGRTQLAFILEQELKSR